MFEKKFHPSRPVYPFHRQDSIAFDWAMEERASRPGKICSGPATCLSAYIFTRFVERRPASGESAGSSPTRPPFLFSLFLEWPITDNGDFAECSREQTKTVWLSIGDEADPHPRSWPLIISFLDEINRDIGVWDWARYPVSRWKREFCGALNVWCRVSRLYRRDDAKWGFGIADMIE